jgi:hypothetical protein
MGPRNYRLYDSKEKDFLRWRYYQEPINAHKAALLEVRWAKIGTTIEVINHETGRMLGQYTLHAAGHITFRGA